MVIEKDNNLLTIPLKRLLRCSREFGLVLKSNTRRESMILFLFELDLAPDLDRTNAIGCDSLFFLMIEC